MSFRMLKQLLKVLLQTLKFFEQFEEVRLSKNNQIFSQGFSNFFYITAFAPVFIQQLEFICGSDYNLKYFTSSYHYAEYSM